MSDVYGMDNGNGEFSFSNIPLGEYTVHCFNTDSTRAFNFNFDMSDIDGNVLDKAYNSSDWVAINFNVVTWDNGIGYLYFNLEQVHVPLFGTITDTAFVSTGSDTKVFLLDEDNTVVAQTTVQDVGYRFTDIPNGYYKLAIQLPLSNDFHWGVTGNLEYIVVEGLVGVVYVQDSMEINEHSKGFNYTVVPGAMGPVFVATDIDNNPVGGVVITIHRQDGQGPVLQAVTTSNGLAFFEGSEVDQWVPYTFSVAWPEGYHVVTPNGQSFTWTGTTDPQQVLGDEN
jgi:hypothetical protein